MPLLPLLSSFATPFMRPVHLPDNTHAPPIPTPLPGPQDHRTSHHTLTLPIQVQQPAFPGWLLAVATKGGDRVPYVFAHFLWHFLVGSNASGRALAKDIARRRFRDDLPHAPSPSLPSGLPPPTPSADATVTMEQALGPSGTYRIPGYVLAPPNTTRFEDSGYGILHAVVVSPTAQGPVLYAATDTTRKPGLAATLRPVHPGDGGPGGTAPGAHGASGTRRPPSSAGRAGPRDANTRGRARPKAVGRPGRSVSPEEVSLPPSAAEVLARLREGAPAPAGPCRAPPVPERAAPGGVDVVIPSGLRDLCKLAVTLRSIATFDCSPTPLFGNVWLVWVDVRTPMSAVYPHVATLRRVFAGTNRSLWFVDGSGVFHRSSGGREPVWMGWELSGIVKLAMARYVQGPWYVVLDSKNTLMAPVDRSFRRKLFDPQGRCWFGATSTDSDFASYGPHWKWANASAKVLGLKEPFFKTGRSAAVLPRAITPNCYSTALVLDLLRHLEGRGVALSQAIVTRGAKGSLLYRMYVFHLTSKFHGHHFMGPGPALLALWRGTRNATASAVARAGAPGGRPDILGIQHCAVSGTTPEVAQAQLSRMYEEAGLTHGLGRSAMLQCMSGEECFR